MRDTKTNSRCPRIDYFLDIDVIHKGLFMTDDCINNKVSHKNDESLSELKFVVPIG